jgi:hypothetical protein
MARSSLPTFPDFLSNRQAIRDEAVRLWSRLPGEHDPDKAKRVLSQLIANPKMEKVWDEIYRQRRNPEGGFFNRACLTNASRAAAYRDKAQQLRKRGGEDDVKNAKLLEFEALMFLRTRRLRPEVEPENAQREQDAAAQQLLSEAYHIALGCKPVKLQDLQKRVDQLRRISEQLREIAGELESMATYYLFRSYAEKVRHVANDCADDAKVLEPNLLREPWLIERERGDLFLRTLVAQLSHCTFQLFLKILPNTVGHIVNVIQEGGGSSLPENTPENSHRLRDAVLQLLGDHHSLMIRPTFAFAILEDPKFQRIFELL